MSPTPPNPPATPKATRRLLAGVSIALGLVILAPVMLSSQDLYAWGRTGLGLVSAWAWLVPVSLDCAAVVCIAMTVVSAWKRERPGVFELLVWVFAGTSAYAQYTHGLTVKATAPAAFWAFPALAILGPVLLHVTLSRLRKWARQDAGELQHGAAGFGASWIPGVAFRETAKAWAASRREGIAGAADARAYVREVAALKGSAKRDAVLYAWQALGHSEPYAARTWLQARHVLVGQVDLDQAAAHLAATAPARTLALPARQRSAAPTSPAPAGLEMASATDAASYVADGQSIAAAHAGDLTGRPYHLAQLAACPNKRAQVRYACSVLGTDKPEPVRTWLAEHSIEVSRDTIYQARNGSALTGETGAQQVIPARSLAVVRG